MEGQREDGGVQGRRVQLQPRHHRPEVDEHRGESRDQSVMVCLLKQGIRPVFRRFILFEG